MYWQRELDFGEDFNCRVIKMEPILGMHYHEELEVALCVSGSYTLTVEGIDYVIGAGDMTVISSNAAHAFRSSPSGAVMAYVLFGRKLVGDDFLPLIDCEFAPPVIRAGEAAPDELLLPSERMREILTGIYGEKTSGGMCSSLLIRALTIELFVLLMRSFPVKNDSGRQIRRRMLAGDCMSGVFSLVKRKYMHDLTVEEAAAAACLSKTYFCRAFKSLTGKTFHEYLLSYRIERAKSLLLTDGMKINEIASAVGMPVVKTFNRCFRERAGMTPREYRKKYIDSPERAQ